MSRPDLDLVIGRVTVELPDPIYVEGGEPIREVYARLLNGKAHLDAGLMPLILSDPEELKNKKNRSKVDDIEETIDRVVIACVIGLNIVTGEPKRGELCVKDITFKSRAAIYKKVCTAGASLYYGTDRSMRGLRDAKMKRDQLEVTKFFYRCCNELGDNLSALDVMDEEQLSKRLAMLQAGDAMRAKIARANKPKPTPGGRGRSRGR